MSESCVICLEEFGEQNDHEQPCKSCKVYFHSTCLREYLKTKQECVFCKRRYFTHEAHEVDEEEGKRDSPEVVERVIESRPRNFVGFMIATLQVLFCAGYLISELVAHTKGVFVDTTVFLCLLFCMMYVVSSYEYFKVLFAIAAHVCGICSVIYIFSYERTIHGVVYSILSLLNSMSSAFNDHPGRRIVPI